MTHYTVADLRTADRHIVEGEQHIVRQELIISDLRASGNPTDTAEELLRQFLESLKAHREHRAAIITALEESGQL